MNGRHNTVQMTCTSGTIGNNLSATGLLAAENSDTGSDRWSAELISADHVFLVGRELSLYCSYSFLGKLTGSVVNYFNFNIFSGVSLTRQPHIRVGA
jgi:hypothetical protein